MNAKKNNDYTSPTPPKVTFFLVGGVKKKCHRILSCPVWLLGVGGQGRLLERTQSHVHSGTALSGPGSGKLSGGRSSEVRWHLGGFIFYIFYIFPWPHGWFAPKWDGLETLLKWDDLGFWKHPRMIIFSRKTHGCWGNPPFQETTIW